MSTSNKQFLINSSKPVVYSLPLKSPAPLPATLTSRLIMGSFGISTMKVHLKSAFCRGPVLFILCAGLLSFSADGAIWSWSGGGGANAYWNNSANWGFAGTPANGDTVIFPASQPNELNTNNIPGLTLNQIVFAGAGGGYDIRGNAFTLTNGLIVTNTTGANTIENDIILTTASVLIVVSNGVSLALDGSLSGSVGVTKAGLGTLLYQCPFTDNSGNNSYTGTTLVAGGTLQVNVGGFNAVSGPLVIGDGTGANSPTVEYLQPSELKYLPSVTINPSGTLNLNNFNEVYFGANLTLKSGTIQTGAGTLTLSANSTITVNSDSEIFGNLNTGSGTLTIQGNNNLDMYASVSGFANIVQNGAVSTEWYAANTYTGNYTVNDTGYVELLNSLALGSISNAMALNGQARIILSGNSSITNQSLTINSTNNMVSMIDVNSSSTNSWTANFTNNSPFTSIYVYTNCAFTMNGPIAGSDGFASLGAGTLTLSGTAANTYAGTTTVGGGTLLLGKPSLVTAIPGPLIIESNTTVRLLNSWQIYNPATPVTMYDSSLFDLAGNSEWVGLTTLQGGQITTGAGILYFSGNINVLASVTPPVISGNIDMYGFNTITVDNSGILYDLQILANIYDNGSGFQVVDGTTPGAFVRMTGTSSFTGPLTISGLTVDAEAPEALGATNGAVTVMSGGELFLYSTAITNKSLILESGSTFMAQYTCSWYGPVNLTGNASIEDFTIPGTFNIAGPISGTGNLTATAPATATISFSGSSANTYVGTTAVTGGTLTLDKPAGIPAVPGNLVVNNSATVLLASSQQTVNSADVLVNSGGLFDFSTFNTYMDTLRGSGTVNFGVNGWIYIGLNNGSSEFDGPFTGTGWAPGWTVGKTGSGTFTIGGNSTYTAGITHVLGGEVVVNGSQPLIPVTVDSGATLGGSGTVGTIAANGIISPGASPVILNSSNVTFSSTGNFTVNLTGPNPGPGGYDQLNVSGTVSLGNATLMVLPAFTAPVSIGQQFTILNNQGANPITGTFSGLPEGSLFNADAYTFRISYVGGTGNDVVLTLWGVPGNTVTVNAVHTGWVNSSGSPTTGNYAVGEDSSLANTNIYRDWFVFDVPVFSGSIIHAELLINSYVNSSPNGQETYLVRKVTTALPGLEAGGVGVYNDLGTNVVYAARSVATNETTMKAIIPLDVQFFNDAAAASGGQIALGGSIATLNPTNSHNQYLFGYSLGNPGDVQLRLTFGSSVVINSTDRGWYESTGSHTEGEPNYFVGNFSGALYNDYFVFNLPVLSSQLVDAQLVVNDYTVASPSGVENYLLYDVTNSINALTNSQSTATNIYTDLGTGVLYGGRNIFGSENGLFSSIPLDGKFVAAALANSGGQIALGGSLPTVSVSSTNEYIFGGSLGLATDAQLWLGFLNSPVSHPGFVDGTPTYLGNNKFQFIVTGTTGTTNEIQGSFDFTRWDFINDVIMTGSSTSFIYTNTTSVLPYRFFRAEQLQ
jgi:autotransporter-associated beta strand protein